MWWQCFVAVNMSRHMCNPTSVASLAVSWLNGNAPRVLVPPLSHFEWEETQDNKHGSSWEIKKTKKEMRESFDVIGWKAHGSLTSHCAVRYHICKTEGQRSSTMRVTSWKLRWLEDTQRPLTSSCRWPHVHYMPLSHAHTHAHTLYTPAACAKNLLVSVSFVPDADGPTEYYVTQI